MYAVCVPMYICCIYVYFCICVYMCIFFIVLSSFIVYTYVLLDSLIFILEKTNYNNEIKMYILILVICIKYVI